jgi:hypothetical protein
MDFFPHRVPPTIVGLATSASLAISASFVSNSAATATNLAGIALNISGSAGASGSNFTKTGVTGPQGPSGPRGFSGKHAYLLAAGWSTGANSICHTINEVGDATFNGMQYTCDFGLLQTFYADSATIVDGVVLYYDSACSTLASSLSNKFDAASNSVFSTDGSGVITTSGVCGSFI